MTLKRKQETVKTLLIQGRKINNNRQKADEKM